MKAFTVHDVFKIARFTDAPCTINKQPVYNRYYTYWAIITPGNILCYRGHTLPLLHGMTSGFLSSISYKSSTLERRGSAAFSLSARSPGREGLPLFWARTRSAPTITMATTRSTATTPIRIPKTGLSSKGTGVPALKDHGHHNTYC